MYQIKAFNDIKETIGGRVGSDLVVHGISMPAMRVFGW
jgi:hypothetical protein